MRFWNRPVSERRTLVLFLALYAGLTAWAWVRYLSYPILERYPLFSFGVLFTDLSLYGQKMTHLNAGAGPVGSGLPVFNYLAPAAFVYSWLWQTGWPVTTFLAVVAAAFVIFLVGSGWMLARRRLSLPLQVLALVLLAGSYPMMLLLARANLEGIVWILLTGFLVLYVRGVYGWSAVLLGLAMSIKPFPGLYVLLFLPVRQFRAALVAVCVAAGSVLLALQALGPTIAAAYQGLQPGLRIYSQYYVWMYRWWYEQEYSHGILDSLKMIRMRAAITFEHQSILYLVGRPIPGSMVVLYFGIVAVLGCTMFWRLRKMPVLNQIFGCAIALTLFPPLCGDYTLCSLYLPLVLLGYLLATQVRQVRQAWTVQHVALLALPLGALMAPLQCFGFYMSIMRCGLLLVLLFGILLLPLAIMGLPVEPRTPSGLRRHWLQ